MLNEEGFRKDAIERQLANGERSKIVAAYNHEQYLPERRDMMQWWGDFVETQGETNRVPATKKINKKYNQLKYSDVFRWRAEWGA